MSSKRQDPSGPSDPAREDSGAQAGEGTPNGGRRRKWWGGASTRPDSPPPAAPLPATAASFGTMAGQTDGATENAPCAVVPRTEMTNGPATATAAGESAAAMAAPEATANIVTRAEDAPEALATGPATAQAPTVERKASGPPTETQSLPDKERLTQAFTPHRHAEPAPMSGTARAGSSTFAPTPTPATPESDSGGSGGNVADADLAPGHVLFKRYEVIKMLGRGGMGTVWLVKHQTLGVERALKLINSKSANNKEIRARFHREAKVMAQFSNHPNAVTVHDAAMKRRVAYIEMEYVKGDSIDHLLVRGEPMPLDWTARILRQLCTVLQVAHDKGIIHRDLKPSNLMLLDGCKPGEEQLKVLDFGIAKMLGQDQAAGDAITVTDLQTAKNSFIGTPPYASPEQASGQAERRSDLYSVGVILFEFLTGCRPFSGPLVSQIHDTLVTPPPRFKKVNPKANVPPDIENFVQRCLKKKPDDRPQSAAALWEEFLAALPPAVRTQTGASLGPVAAPGTRRVPVRRTPRIRPRLVVGLVLLGLLLAAGAGLAWVLNRRSWPPKDYAPVVEAGKENGRDKTLVYKPDGTRFPLIPGGKFLMGDWNQPEKCLNVKLSDFYMQESEVTNGQMLRYFTQVNKPEIIPSEFKAAYDQLIKNGVSEDEALQYPAVGIPHDLAAEYARWAGGALPTEAQFEYAERSGGKEKRFPWGNDPSKEKTRIDRPAEDYRPAPVKSVPTDQTEQGIFDLAGNVHEWCRDVWDVLPVSKHELQMDYEGPDPTEASQYVIRARAMMRRRSPRRRPHIARITRSGTTRREDLGFRIVLEPPRGGLLGGLFPKTTKKPPPLGPPAKADEAKKEPAGPVPAVPPPPPVRTPQKWAVVIGVEQYADSDARLCRGTVVDARKFRNLLVTEAKWDSSHVLLLTDDGSNPLPDPAAPAPKEVKSTQENFQWAFQKWLAPRLKAGDLAVVYFAGQAVSLSADSEYVAKSPTAHRELLLPQDSQTTAPLRWGFALEDALDTLPERGQCSIVCLLDTSPWGRKQTVKGFTKVDKDAGQRWLASLARWPGVSVWMAADGQAAKEKSLGGGQFTESLLRALGTTAQPRALVAALERLNHDADLARVHFRTRGGLTPRLTLWSEQLLPAFEDDPQYRLFLQRGHARQVLDIAYSADGSQLFSAGEDSTVRFWRVADRTLLRVLTSPAVGVKRLVLSPDGRRLALGDGAGVVRVWDFVESKERTCERMPGDPAPINRLAFLPDSTHLIALNEQGVCSLWKDDGKKLALVKNWPGKAVGLLATAEVSAGAGDTESPGAVVALVPLKDDATLGDQLLTYRDVAQAPSYIESEPGITCLCLSPDGRRRAIGTGRGRVKVQRLMDKWQTIFDEETWEGPVATLALSGESLLVQSGSPGAFQTRLVYHLIPGLGGKTKSETEDLKIAEPLERITFAPGGRAVAVVTAETGTVHAWTIDETLIPITLSQENAPSAIAVGIAPDGRQLAIGGQEGSIRFFDLSRGGKPVATIPAHRGQVAHIAVAPEERLLLQVTRDRTASIWDLADRSVIPLPGAFLPGGAFVPKSSLLALVNEEGAVVLYDPALARVVSVLAKPAGSKWNFDRVSVSPDGRFVAAGCDSAPSSLYGTSRRMPRRSSLPPRSASSTWMESAPSLSRRMDTRS